MNYDNLPIYKSALNLCIYAESIVKTFDKYNKYTIGEDLRVYSKNILFLIHKANRHKQIDTRKKVLNMLVEKCEEFKMLIQLSKELKVFKTFKSFEYISKLVINVAKQSQAWFNYTSNNKNPVRVSR